MFFNCVGVRVVTPWVFVGNLIHERASRPKAQNDKLDGSVDFAPRDERAMSTQPLVSLTRAVIPADEPLGGGLEPLYVVLPQCESPATVNDGPGNGAVSTG